jgi:hypothetical protein
MLLYKASYHKQPPSGKKLKYVNIPAKKHGASSAHTIEGHFSFEMAEHFFTFIMNYSTRHKRRTENGQKKSGKNYN